MLTQLQEGFFGDRCKKTFSDPPVGTKSVDDEPTPWIPPSLPINPQCAGTPQNTEQQPFTRAAAKTAIFKFCLNSVKDPNWFNQIIVPAISNGTGETSDGRPKKVQVANTYNIPGLKTQLWMDLIFNENGCIGNFQFNPHQCLNRLMTVLDSCNLDNTDQKYGGSAVDGCAVFRLTGRDPKLIVKNSNYPLSVETLEQGIFSQDKAGNIYLQRVCE
jgi:hypothetical protein